jgi:hypothetical protein
MSLFNQNVLNDQVTISNVSIQLLQDLSQDMNSKRNRKAFVIRNTSTVATDIITLTFGNVVAQNNKGIVLKQNETYYENTDVSFEAWQGSIQAICNQASVISNLSIFERQDGD